MDRVLDLIDQAAFDLGRATGVGTRLQWPSINWGVDDKLTIIKVDADAAEMDRVRTPEIALVGDAATVVARLADHLRQLPAEAVRDDGPRTAGPEMPDEGAAARGRGPTTCRATPGDPHARGAGD